MSNDLENEKAKYTEEFRVAQTPSSPAIRVRVSSFPDGAGIVEMHGDSYPENSFEFFAPLLNWIERFLAETTQPLRLQLHLLYLNTSSVKAIMDIFELLEKAHHGGRDVTVRWNYDHENARIAELAEEFKEDCTFPFDIVEVI